MAGRWQTATTRARLGLARHGIGPGRSFESGITWILGSPRSGSTWLLLTLGHLPGVVPINEPLIGRYLGDIVCDYRGISVDGLDVSNFTFERQRRRVDDQFFSPAYRDVWSPLLGKLIKARFLAHVTRHPPDAPLSKTTVLVKEPNGSQSADLLLGALPRSRALFLLRDGRDVIDSELAAFASGGWLSREFDGITPVGPDERLEFVVRSASKWLWRTEVVQEATEGHAGPTLTVKYEDLLADPLRWFATVARWLALDAGDEELRGAVHGHDFERLPAEVRGPDEFFRAAEPGLWRKNLSADEQAAIEGVIGDKLRQLGYET